eukprot:TRINITY_DN7479_c0_g1_i1.p1 TRINITY_DN7479_c0_g1~~TRINITY_DN7479_c0_g1_i1.p1  ORF type:complete len:928 (+),score=256.21 TRINITY_DN7479_c0_g1_i1:59-2842(+)
MSLDSSELTRRLDAIRDDLRSKKTKQLQDVETRSKSERSSLKREKKSRTDKTPVLSLRGFPSDRKDKKNKPRDDLLKRLSGHRAVSSSDLIDGSETKVTITEIEGIKISSERKEIGRDTPTNSLTNSFREEDAEPEDDHLQEALKDLKIEDVEDPQSEQEAQDGAEDVSADQIASSPTTPPSSITVDESSKTVVVTVKKTKKNRLSLLPSSPPSAPPTSVPDPGPRKLMPIGLAQNAALMTVVTLNESTKLFFRSISPLNPNRIQAKDADGNTALHWAALLGQLEVIRVLIRRGAKLAEKNARGVTPLHYACCKISMLHTMCAEFLILNGAKMNSKNMDNETPLHYAVNKGKRSRGPNNLATVQILAKWRADTTIRDRQYGRLPLHYAALYGQAQACNILIEKAKTSLHSKDNDDFTSLHLAVMSGSLDCTHLLLLRGALLNQITKDGSTVLHLACKYKRSAILDLLLNTIEKNTKHFKLIEKKDKHGFTCVHWAAIKGDIECLKLFPDLLDIPDNVGLTPLHWAIIKGNRACAHYLISKRVKITSPEFGGESSIFHPMCDDFETAVDSPQYSDITLKVDGHVIHAHKAIIARCLKTFVKDNKETQRLKINNLPQTAVRDFCIYLYTGKIPSQEDRSRDLLKVSSVYGLPFLRQMCENEIINKGRNPPRISTLPLHLTSLLEKSTFSDCTFQVEGKNFKLHRIVLARRSQWFHELLEEDPKRSPDDVIPITNMSKSTFKLIIEYLYTDIVTKTQTMLLKELRNLFLAGKQLELFNLMKRTEYYFIEHINDQTAADILLISEEEGMMILKKACVSYIAGDFKQLAKSGSLEALQSSQLLEMKKVQKEFKKQQNNEEKEKRKSLKRSLSRLGSPSVAEDATPSNVTPELFFSKRNTLTTDMQHLGGSPPPMRNSLHTRPILPRRNSTCF